MSGEMTHPGSHHHQETSKPVSVPDQEADWVHEVQKNVENLKKMVLAVKDHSQIVKNGSLRKRGRTN